MTSSNTSQNHYSVLNRTNFRLFEGLDESQLQLVSSSMTQRRFSAQENLLKIGEDSDRILFIIEGLVNVEIPLVGGNSKEKIASLGIGQTVGEFSLVRDGKVTANVVAVGDVLALEAKCSNIRELLESNPRIGCAVYRNLSRISIDRLVDTNMLARNVLSQISLF